MPRTRCTLKMAIIHTGHWGPTGALLHPMVRFFGSVWQYTLDGLLLEAQYVKEESFSTSPMAQCVICSESGQKIMKYGFYRRVFVNSDRSG